jgi:integrase
LALLEGTDVAAMRLNAITKDDADRLTFPGGPSNHNNALRTLRRMLGKAEEWTIIKASPKIKLMQEHAWERVIDADIEAKLLPFCKQPLRDVLMIMRDSGMRNQKEVFRMRWEHLDWGNKRYFVYESKSPKGRRFVLNSRSQGHFRGIGFESWHTTGTPDRPKAQQHRGFLLIGSQSTVLQRNQF